MGEIEKLTKNTLFSFLSQITRVGTNIVLFILIARAVGVEDFGKFSFALAFTTMFLYLADFGLGTLTTREISRDRTIIERYIGNIIAIKIFFSVIVFSLIWMIINIMGYPSDTKLLVALSSGDLTKALHFIPSMHQSRYSNRPVEPW